MMDKEEYQSLIEGFYEEAYDLGDDDDIDIEQSSIQPNLKLIIRNKSSKELYGIDRLKEAVGFKDSTNLNNFAIDTFYIRVKRYSYERSDPSLMLDIYIYEDGPDSVFKEVDFKKDIRFKDKLWLKYFTYNTARLPIDTVIEIADYLKKINKLKMFC